MKTHNPDLNVLVQQISADACSKFNRKTAPPVVVSPYRFNPLGAHVDHQGGQVMARTLNHYTLLAFWENRNSTAIHIKSDQSQWKDNEATFTIGDTSSETSWIRYAQAATAALAKSYSLKHGISGLVRGTMVGAGLSSSSSVILAYLTALARANSVTLSDLEIIEIARQVENEYMGLNNGIQDQMSIVYGNANALSLLNVQSGMVEHIQDPVNVGEISWVVCYSGFSRELISSNFNTRVSECREAAVALNGQATILSDVGELQVDNPAIDKLPTALANRARHFFSETRRVSNGAKAWADGDFEQFGQLMNDSCESSIKQYECGSQPLIDLHGFAKDTDGVLGSRFSGGGYGGCLVALCKHQSGDAIARQLEQAFIDRYPEKKDLAYAFVARAEEGIRIENE